MYPLVCTQFGLEGLTSNTATPDKPLGRSSHGSRDPEELKLEDLDALLTDWVEEPIGTASIGQVYQAACHVGRTKTPRRCGGGSGPGSGSVSLAYHIRSFL